MRKFLTFLVIFIVVSAFYYMNIFFTVSNTLTDIFLSGEREADPSIKILGIDDESLERIGRWPWPRDILADLTDDLVNHGAKAVFVDVLYTEESDDPKQDARWQEVLDQHENVYFPMYFTLSPYQEDPHRLSYDRANFPIYDIDEDQLAHINAWEGSDRVVREVLLGIPLDENTVIPAMAVRLANLYLPDDFQITWTKDNEWFYGDIPIATGNYSQVYFSYTSTPTDRKFEIIPIADAIDGTVDLSHFKDATVLIGPYSVGLQDMYYVPNSQTRMFGVELHANIMQSLIDGMIFNEVSPVAGMMVIGLVAGLAYFLMERVNARWAILVAVLFIVTYTIVFHFVLERQNLILPLFYVVFAIIVCYVTSIVSQYLLERRERSRVTGLFGRYVSQAVVDEILSNPDAIKLGGERKDVTLLFIDIRGFTPLSEKMEPEDVINVLNEYLDLCTQAIFKYGGTLDKFIGDGVMAIFGAPVPQEDHAKRAVLAGIELKSQADELNRRIEEKYGRSVRFGMGINSGPAVIGNIGSKERLEYTAIGDTVNLASRLESNAKPGQILISEETYRRVKDDFVFKELPPLKVKGKEKPVNVYEVEGKIIG